MPKREGRKYMTYKKALIIASTLQRPTTYALFISKMMDVHVNTVSRDLRVYEEYLKVYGNYRPPEEE